MPRNTNENLETMLLNEYNEDPGVVLWSDYKKDPINDLFDELFPELDAYWKVKNLAATHNGYTYELWFSRLTDGQIREDVLLAQVRKYADEWTPLYTIDAVFDQHRITFIGNESLAPTCIAMHRRWMQWEEDRAIALLSATHPRLGAQSPAAKLDRDLLVMIGKMCLQ